MWCFFVAVALFVSCTPTGQMSYQAPSVMLTPLNRINTPSPDPRVGLDAGLFDAETSIWNLNFLSTTPPPKDFLGVTNSDLAFTGHYVIQGNYNGFMVWDISNPAEPKLVEDYLCPASQSDVSIYKNLLFVSGEGLGGRLDCGAEGVEKTVSDARLRGIRIFDVSDFSNPVYVANVQTCRGSHTHSVLKDPDDDENVYIYVSGSAGVRPDAELEGCSDVMPSEDPNSALFRIEVIKVPLDNPKDAHIVSSPRIFEDLEAPPTHGMAPAGIAALEKAKKEGAFIITIGGNKMVLPDRYAQTFLDNIVKERGGTGAPTPADSAALRKQLPGIIAKMSGGNDGANRGPTQCHDITLYPEIGLAGGACEGYGLLLDISDPAHPVRIDAVADSNFSYWHSATFSNDGSKVLFTDEWGGGSQPKCRETDPMEWGADAIFTIEDGKMEFQSYYKLSAAQTPQENCVAHNGSLIPIPGRTIMVQAWYQGGISVFDWTDPNNAVEIAYFDRGPIDAEQMHMGGSWSIYWYNGALYSSEIARGLDVFQLKPSPVLSKNEIAAARTVKLDYLNAQGQPHFEWPATFVLARAYVDQLDRNSALSQDQIAQIRQKLFEAENNSGSNRRDVLNALADNLENNSANSEKVEKLAETVRDLASE